MRARDFDPEDAAFIRASIAARNAELNAAARFRRRVQLGTAIAAITMSILAVVAILGWREASQREQETAEVMGNVYDSFASGGPEGFVAIIMLNLQQGVKKATPKL